MPYAHDPPILALTLPDGAPVHLRPVLPQDRVRIARGFETLSELSRIHRFLVPVRALSEAQLRYLTELDHVHHVAWGALDPRDPDAPGLGVARFVRLDARPDVAEFSLTVVDAAQGHGVGTLLLALLYVLAERLGITRLRGLVARDNGGMSGWMMKLGGTVVDADGDLVIDLPVHVKAAAFPDGMVAHAFGVTVEQVKGALEAHPRAGAVPRLARDRRPEAHAQNET